MNQPQLETPQVAIEPTEKRDDKPVIRYFVSYAHDDQKLKDRLLKPLKQHLAIAKNYCFEAWDDAEILVGEHWHEQIQAAVARCQFGLVLVSPAFLGSEYIKDHELPAFVVSNLADPESEKRAIPVALKHIPFDNSIDLKGLEKLQVFHSAGRAFQERRDNKARDDFALELFQNILKIVKRYGMVAGRNDDQGLKIVNGEQSERLHQDQKKLKEYLGIESKGSRTVVVLYCKLDNKFNKWRLEVPGKQLAESLKVPGKQLAENLSRVLSPEGNGKEGVTLCSPGQNDSVDWKDLEEYETLFIVDSKWYNPYLKLVLNSCSKYLKGKVDFNQYGTVPGTKEPLQEIVIKGHKASPFQSTKYKDQSERMRLIDKFEDYLLIMRLPREIKPGTPKCHVRKGVIWVIAGIHGKATQAGVSFLTGNDYSTLLSYLSNGGASSLPEFFEAVFRIPKESKCNDEGLVLHFNDLDLDTLGNDRTAPKSNLVYFQELHTSTEPGLRDSRPFGLAEYFCSKKSAEIPIHSVRLDVVAGCNFDCPDCIEKPWLRELRAMLSFTSICKMLIELREAGCVRVRFDGGEPTLHPDFPWIVRLAAALGFEMDLVTNGSFLSDPEIQQAIVSAKDLLQLRVSLSGYSPGVSQKPLPPDLKDTTVKAVRDLIGEGVTVAVSMLLYNGCIEEVEEAHKFWRSKGAKLLCLLPVLNEGGAGQKHELTANDKLKLQGIMDKSRGWVIVPDWYREQLNGNTHASTTEEEIYNCCYSAYYSIAISPAEPAEGIDEATRQTNWKSLQLRETDRAWISSCPYHRYDEGYGCDYSPRGDKGGLRKWMEGRRLEIAQSIKPNKCQKTTCSSDADNRQTYREIKGI